MRIQVRIHRRIDVITRLKRRARNADDAAAAWHARDTFFCFVS
jgi:hypothetical protein